MQGPLDRLYHTKIAFLATVLIVSGLGLLLFGHWVESRASLHWLAQWPIVDIGSGLFTTGLLGVAWQYVDGQDGEERDTERLRRVLAESAPAMRDAVIHGFAFAPSDLARVATPEMLDQIVTNGLALRLNDADFAADLYRDINQQAIDIPERLHNARIQIRLSPIASPGATKAMRDELFAVTVHWEFDVIPQSGTRRFVCVDDLDEFRDVTQDGPATSAWYFKPKAGLTAANQAAFELIDFTIDGEARKIRRTSKADSQIYSVSFEPSTLNARDLVTVAYTYRTVTARAGHLLRLRVDQPTKGLSIELDYGDTDLSDVAIVDFIASGERTRLSRSSDRVPEKTISLDFDGWALPRSGIALVW